jgi:CheY-like chemotaxis protein
VVSGDGNRLQQVLWNLLSNAVKFTPSGGRIQVLLERINSHLKISVIDTGDGIAPEFLPYVFDRFRQGDASTSRRHGGLGLGLSIVRQLVELHGGSVGVKSDGPGRGSTFTVSLPLTVVQLYPDPATSRRHPRQPFLGKTNVNVEIEGVRVLLVDDELDARALLKRILEDFQAIVTVAESADEAIEFLQAGKFDVLVSDIGMPGEDGYSLIRRIRSLGAARGGDIPAIALTAYARGEDRIKAVAAGFQMHVAKPVEAIELVTMIAGAWGLSITSRTGKTSS